MPVRLSLALAAVVFAGSLAGCAAASRGYVDPTDEKSAKWVGEAGREARAGMQRESSTDPLGLRNVFMSEKARDIERNLGYD